MRPVPERCASHLLCCVKEFCSVLMKQVEAAVVHHNFFLQKTAKLCHTAQQMGRQITVLIGPVSPPASLFLRTLTDYILGEYIPSG